MAVLSPADPSRARFDPLDGPIVPTLLRLAAPNILAMFIQSAMHITDAYFIGQVDRTALAGVALVFPMLMLTTMLSSGAIGGGVAGAIARALGAGDRARAESILRHAVVVAVGCGLLFMAVFLLFGRPIYGSLGGRGEALEAALAYSDLLFGGVLTIWLFNILASAVRGSGRMGFSAGAIALVTAVQIPLSWALTLGFGPVPSQGIAGPAVATIAAFGMGTLWLLADLVVGASPLRLRWSGRFSGAVFAATLRTGGLAAINPFLTVATVLIVNAIVGGIGEGVLAGYGIGARLEFLMVPIIFGIGAALITLVGANAGAGRHDRARRIVWTGAFAAGTVTGAIGLMAALFPSLWSDLFTRDPETAAACQAYLRIVGPCYALFGLGLALHFAAHGLGSILWPVLGGVLRVAIIAIGCLTLVATEAGSPTTLFAILAGGMAAYGLFNATALRYFGRWPS